MGKLKAYYTANQDFFRGYKTPVIKTSTITLPNSTLLEIYYDLHHAACMAKERYKDATTIEASNSGRDYYVQLCDKVEALEDQLVAQGILVRDEYGCVEENTAA